MANRRTVTKVISSNVAVTGTNVYNSPWFPMESFNSVGCFISITGTQTGTITVDTSYDAPTALESGAGPVNIHDNIAVFVTAALTTSIPVSGNLREAFELGINGSISANWIRVTYTNATNSGVIDSITFVGKAFG